jgi:hypothetical protein
MGDPFGTPDEDHEAKLAHSLLITGRELPLRVLHELLQGPSQRLVLQ